MSALTFLNEPTRLLRSMFPPDDRYVVSVFATRTEWVHGQGNKDAFLAIADIIPLRRSVVLAADVSPDGAILSALRAGQGPIIDEFVLAALAGQEAAAEWDGGWRSDKPTEQARRDLQSQGSRELAEIYKRRYGPPVFGTALTDSWAQGDTTTVPMSPNSMLKGFPVEP